MVCDVCFLRVDPRAEVCPRCGSAFDDAGREHHEAVPEQWVAAQIARLRAMTYDELRVQLDAPQEYEVPVDEEGRFVLLGETEVLWDAKPGADLRVMVAIWNDEGGRPLAGDSFIRAPDGSFVDE